MRTRTTIALGTAITAGFVAAVGCLPGAEGLSGLAGLLGGQAGGSSTAVEGINGTLTGSTSTTSSSVVEAFLPDSIAEDLSDLPDDGALDSAAPGRDGGLSNGTFPNGLRVLGVSKELITGFHRLADAAIKLAGKVRFDLKDKGQTQVQGTFRVNEKVVGYKADFAAFDIDGDGQADGSGTPGTLPVAVRIWTDLGDGSGYQRFMCAVVTERRNEKHLGAGTLFVKPAAAAATSYPDTQIAVNWNRTGEDYRWQEAFISGQVGEQYAMSIGQQRVDTRYTSAGGVENTIRSNSALTKSPQGFTNVSFQTHYRRGSWNALVSGTATGGPVTLSVSNLCLNIKDQKVADPNECASFDVQDFTPLSAPLGTEEDFPADFPATPTF